MAAQVQQSVSFVSALGADFVKAHEKAKNVKVENKGNTLPDGLRGIAQLRWIGIKRIEKGDNKGKVMFYADATIQEPESFGGLKVAGKRTFISEPLYDTPKRQRKTVADHITHVYTILKMFGIKTELLKASQIDAAVASLMKTKPFVAFRIWRPAPQTSGPYAGKEAMQFHMWDETVEYKKPDIAAASVNVELPPVVEEPPTDPSEANGTADATGYTGVYDDTHNGTFPDSGGTSTGEATDTVATGSEEVAEGGSVDSGLGTATLEELARLATENELMSIDELTSRAIALGFTQKEVNDSESWDWLIAEMKKRSATEIIDGEPEGTPINVGDKFNYRPLNPTTKKKSDTAVGVEVIGLNGDTGTVDLRNLVNRKIVYKNIPVDELEDVT